MHFVGNTSSAEPHHVTEARRATAVTRFVDVLVIGAGPTGMGAAYRLADLNADWLLVEATDAPGGMAGSTTDAHGFTWDFGGHVLHSHFDTFDRAIAGTGIEMLRPTRNGWIWTDGELVPTPIQHQVDELPDDLDPDGPATNLAEYYRNQFGAKLYDEFFDPFTRKMWATPLEQVDHQWTSLRGGSAERNVPSLRLRGARASEPVTFPYPAGGTGRLWHAIASRLDQSRIRYGVSVESIDLDRRTAHLNTGETISYAECVSSMPLTQLLTSVGRPELAERAPQFLSSQALVVGLGFEGVPPPALADKSWLYNPDGHIAWHRATMLSNYDPANAGEGRWSVLCEIGRSAFRAVNDAEAISSCQLSMAQLGARPADLITTWSRTLPMGYPVPTLGRDDLLTELDGKLVQQGVRSRGRFGGWRYESCNQDYSFMQGVEAVDAALDGAPEDVYWHPERW